MLCKLAICSLVRLVGWRLRYNNIATLKTWFATWGWAYCFSLVDLLRRLSLIEIQLINIFILSLLFTDSLIIPFISFYNISFEVMPEVECWISLVMWAVIEMGMATACWTLRTLQPSWCYIHWVHRLTVLVFCCRRLN